MTDESGASGPEERAIQALTREVRAGFAVVDRRFADLQKRIEKRMKEDAETTRRHFDVVAESLRDTIKVIAESEAHHATVLGDHEVRIKTLEGR